MRIEMESLVSYEEWIEAPEKVLEKVEALGEVVVVKGNKPAYHIKALETEAERAEETLPEKPKKKQRRKPAAKKTAGGEKPAKPEKKTEAKKGMTLKEAARKVLEAAEGGELHVKELADAIFEQGLYTKRDGSKAPYTQVRAMCGQYKEDFEALEGNRVRLKG